MHKRANATNARIIFELMVMWYHSSKSTNIFNTCIINAPNNKVGEVLEPGETKLLTCSLKTATHSGESIFFSSMPKEGLVVIRLEREGEAWMRSVMSAATHL